MTFPIRWLVKVNDVRLPGHQLRGHVGARLGNAPYGSTATAGIDPGAAVSGFGLIEQRDFMAAGV